MENVGFSRNISNWFNEECNVLINTNNTLFKIEFNTTPLIHETTDYPVINVLNYKNAIMTFEEGFIRVYKDSGYNSKGSKIYIPFVIYSTIEIVDIINDYLSANTKSHTPIGKKEIISKIKTITDKFSVAIGNLLFVITINIQKHLYR